jgi:hypothetical protein
MLSDINNDDDTRNNFKTEILLHFDQILKTFTFDAWDHNKENVSLKEAKARTKSFQMMSATATTAKSIAKATEYINNKNEVDAET